MITIIGVSTYPNHMYVPYAHIYMNGKSQADYSKMLSIIFSCLVPYKQCSVTKVVIDFETAMKNALEETTQSFGKRVTVKGCLFHCGQAIYRYYAQNVPEDSLQNRRLLYYLLWLPYVDHSTISEFMKIMMSTKHEELDWLLNYFQNQWMRIISWWHVEDGDDVDTNCAIESFHGKLNHEIRGTHPPIRDSAEVLLKMDVKYMNMVVNRLRDDEQHDRVTTRRKMFMSKKDMIVAKMMAFARSFEDAGRNIGKKYVLPEINTRDGAEMTEMDKEVTSEAFATVNEENDEELWQWFNEI